MILIVVGFCVNPFRKYPFCIEGVGHDERLSAIYGILCGALPECLYRFLRKEKAGGEGGRFNAGICIKTG